MNKTPRLSKSGIEYLDYQWGIFSGCENWANGICPVPNCWARSIAHRFPNHYPHGFNPTYYPKVIDSPKHLKKPSIIGVGWVGDIIGYGLAYKSQIYSTIEACPWHTFLFLTKNADQLIKWANFPDNCWVGVTATGQQYFVRAVSELRFIEAKIKYLSFEPLLYYIPMLPEALTLAGINWVIIGAQTNPYKPPKIEWVEEIVRACDKAGVKVFLKDNLTSLLPIDRPFYKPIPLSGWDDNFDWELRQEMPR